MPVVGGIGKLVQWALGRGGHVVHGGVGVRVLLGRADGSLDDPFHVYVEHLLRDALDLYMALAPWT